MAVAGLYQVALRSTLDGTVRIANTFVLKDSSGAGDPFTTVVSVANALAATGTGGIATAYAGMLTAADKLDEVRVSQVPTPGDTAPALVAASAFPAIAGTRAGSTVDAPHELTATVTLQTIFSGRRYRGRMFLPPAKQASAQKGEIWDPGNVYWTSMQAFGTQFGKLIAGASGHLTGALSAMNLQVYSASNEADEPGTGDTDVTALRLNPKIHWLRSRAV